MSYQKFFLNTFLVFSFTGAVYYFSTSGTRENVSTLNPESFARMQFTHNARKPASARPKNRPSTVLYKLKANPTTEQKRQFELLAKDVNLRPSKKMIQQKIQFARSFRQENQEEDLAKALLATGAVEFAEADKLVELSSRFNDPLLSQQWHHPKIHSQEAWTTAGVKNKIIVASCDTGVESTHPDLQRNLLFPGYNTEDGSSNAEPVNPHGTLTAGALGALISNREGVAGVAEKISLLPIRISNFEDGSAYISSIASCIEYAADRGAKVVNVSYEGASSYSIHFAAEYLRAKGGLLVMAAGNAGRDLSFDPDFRSFILVGATDQNDNRAQWSNYGSPIDIVAPGQDILTTAVNKSYGWASGTSFSSPIVAGVVAMIYSVKPTFTPDEVEDILFSSASPLGSGVNDPQFGSGRVDAKSAVTMAIAFERTKTKPKSKHNRRKRLT